MEKNEKCKQEGKCNAEFTATEQLIINILMVFGYVVAVGFILFGSEPNGMDIKREWKYYREGDKYV